MAYAEIYGLVDYSYQQTKSTTDDETTKSKTVNQGYTLGFSHALTPVLTVSGDVRVSVNKTDDDKKTTVFPFFTLYYNPPQLYNLSFSYSRTESAPSNGDHIASSNLNLGFSLPLEKWPTISATYNRSATSDYKTPHDVDSVSGQLGLNADYTFVFYETDTKLNYSVTRSTQEDRVQEVDNESLTNTATATFNRFFLNNRIIANANIGYSRTDNTNQSLGGLTRFDRTLEASTGHYDIDASPDSGALSGNAALIDRNTVTSAGIDLNGAYRNIGIQLPFAQAVHKLNLYVSTSEPNIINLMETNSFGFTVYSSDNGSTWTPLGSLSVDFEPAFSRAAITFTETTAKYFKIVNSSPVAALTINVTELEAIGFILDTPEESVSYTTQRQFGGMSLSYRPIDRLDLNYNLNFDHTTQGVLSINSTNVNHGVNANYIAIPRYLTVSTGFITTTTSTSQEDATGGTTDTESGTDNYTLTLSSSPLPTLNGSFNYGHFVNTADGTAQSKSDSFTANAFMKLYRGVDLSMVSSLNETRDLTADSKSTTISSSMALNLMPWKELTILINGGQSSTDTDTSGAATSTSSTTLSTTISYAPTRKIFTSASLSFEPASSQSYSVSWLPTRSIQASVRYGKASSLTSMGGDVSWTPIPKLSLQGGYSSSESQGDASTEFEMFFGRASLRF